MGESKNDKDTVQNLLAIALDDEQLPEGAEKRCIDRVAVETGPFRVIRRPKKKTASSPDAERQRQVSKPSDSPVDSDS